MRSRSFSANRCKDREDQFANAVAGDVPTELDHVQADAQVFQLLQRGERISCVAEWL
jgi:hypothetical protein